MDLILGATQADAENWRTYMEMAFTVVGGLAIFMFGMAQMSDGMKRIAGGPLRSMLSRTIKWPIIGLLTGTGVTVLIQSSSATSVITVGLINAGLLSLKQALSIILGANIGTTITGWIVASFAGYRALKITAYTLPIVAIGFTFLTFFKRPKLKNIGMILFGLGILFLGLSLMKDGMGDLGDKEGSPLIQAIRAIGDQPWLAILAGVFFTMVIQSSSASIAMVILVAIGGGFSSDPYDSLRIAIPFVLGDNIGTTVTAQIAALQSNINGRRAAMGHTIFNVFGVLVMLPFIWFTDLYAGLIYNLGIWMNLDMQWQIALAHTLFNVTAAALFLPLLGILERTVVRILPSRREDHEDELPVVLERHLLDTPELAIHQAKSEIARMAKTARKALKQSLKAILYDDQKAIKKVYKHEDKLDEFQTEITRYVIELSQRKIGPGLADQMPVLLHTVNDLERVGDHSMNIAEIAERKIGNRQKFTDKATADLSEMGTELRAMAKGIQNVITDGDIEGAQSALVHERKVNEIQKIARQDHVDRWCSEGECDAMTGLTFVDCIDNFEKIGDHLANIAESVIQGGKWLGEEDAHRTTSEKFGEMGEEDYLETARGDRHGKSPAESGEVPSRP
ncbi:MAG: Na/Pi cotransporter family protein [Phycisphaerae bacterium]